MTSGARHIRSPGSTRPSSRTSGSSSADVFVLSRRPELEYPGSNPFGNTTWITIPQRRDFAPTLELFSIPDRVSSSYDDATETAIYMIGRPAHPRLSGATLAAWCGSAARDPNPGWLRDLLGQFVIVIDDRRAREITFISDALGLRPWFVGSHGGRLVAGTNVLAICAAGLSSGNVDYDAVSCWLKFNHDCTGGSVVEDYKSLAPATVSTFDPAGKLLRQVEYGRLEFTDKFLPPDQMTEMLHDVVSRSFHVQTKDVGEVNFPLSGGFDSRLLFALACRSGLRTHATTLHTRDHELAIAQQVADAMEHPLTVIRSRRRILDLFDDPFSFSGSGFPTGRNLTNTLARRLPGMPLVSGFLGDGVMRGPLTDAGVAWWAKDRQNLSADELARDVHDDYTMHLNRFGLLRESVVRGLNRRSLQCIRRVIERGQQAGKPVLYTDLFTRHRLYFANVFIQHLDAAEAIVPFASWELMNARTSFDQRCYTGENFRQIFERHFPQLAHIGHTSTFIPNATNKRVRPKAPASRHLRRFSADVAAALLLTDSLSCARKKRIFTLLPSGLLGEPLYQDEITFAYKLQLFERTLRRCGIRLDWDRL